MIICIKVEYWIVDPQKNKFFNTCTSCCTLHSPLTWMSVRCKSLKLWIFWTEWVWEGGSDWYWGETASKQNTGRTESPLPYPSPETFLLSLDRELIQCKGKLHVYNIKVHWPSDKRYSSYCRDKWHMLICEFCHILPANFVHFNYNIYW